MLQFGNNWGGTINPVNIDLLVDCRFLKSLAKLTVETERISVGVSAV